MRSFLPISAAALLAGCAGTPVPDMTASSAPLAPLPTSVTSELPRNARPYHYQIEIAPDAEALRFTGFTAVDLELFEPSRTITLNASKLKIARASLTPVGEGGPVALRVALDAEKETASFTAPEAVPAGRYRLAIDYTGEIGTQASGIFALDYPDKRNGETVRALFTQFETPDAREFAPMFDEPSYKATFDLSAVVPAELMAVSNMPVEQEEQLGDGNKRVRFGTTPPMSTYLLFFGLGDFERMAKDAGDGVEVGIVAPAGSGETARYALDALAPLIPFYNDYFGVKYPMPKLDNIAGPGSSQQFGAMENWGAIFTFEGNLLLDPTLTSPGRLNYLYTAQAHEVAHQWFGDIVTMAWWDDLWLNEGFASWMETKATAHFKPEWHALVGRVNTRERAMGLDSLASTHPVVIHAETAAEADLNFDAISYSKGESVIAMLEAYAGEDTWRDGIRRYMAEHKFGNAVTADLWHAAEEAGAGGLTAIADSFTRQPGIPLVTVTSASCTNGRTTLALTQGEFSRDRKDEVTARPQHWLVPLTVRAANGSIHRVLLDGSATVEVPGCGPAIVNGGQLGYFRTLYPPETLARLTEQLPGLSAVDQLGLYKDNLALSDAGYQDYAPALDLLAAMPVDANPVVADAAVGSWDGYYDILEDDAAKARLAALVHDAWLPRLRQLGFDPVEGESVADTSLRATLISTLGNMGDETVAGEARRRFAALAQDKTALDGPLKTTWLAIAAKNADEKDWEFLRSLAAQSGSGVERDIYRSLLGNAVDERLARKALRLALTDEVSATNGASIISRVSGEHPDMAYDFALANRAKVLALVDDSSKPSFLPALAGQSTDPAMLGKLETLLAGTPAAEKLPVTKAIASLRQRLASRPRTRAQLAAWLAARD